MERKALNQWMHFPPSLQMSKLIMRAMACSCLPYVYAYDVHRNEQARLHTCVDYVCTGYQLRHILVEVVSVVIKARVWMLQVRLPVCNSNVTRMAGPNLLWRSLTPSQKFWHPQPQVPRCG